MNLIYTNKLLGPRDIFSLYVELGWNDFLKLTEKQLSIAMEQSWYVVYVYDDERLIATGRVVSDGVINAYICGLGVVEEYRKKGIGSEVFDRLVSRCKENSLHIQLLCEEELVPYYRRKGFEVFTIGMKSL